ncbi:MAG: hypothetical protein P9L99_16345 [Candidatus Lernaella stagnicola]|nr:hypothetical protein [Candidatus Lernaella stagnicola]
MTRLRCGALIVVLLLVFAWSALAADTDALLAQGEAAWLQRSASDENVRRAIEFFTKAGEAGSAEGYYKAARGYYFLGRFTEGKQRKDVFLKGATAAKRGWEIDLNSVGSHYWYVANLAKSLQDKGVVAKMKRKNEILQHLKTCRKLDASFYYGGPDRILGMLAYKSPVGSNEEAIKRLRVSLKLAPNYSLTLVSLGEVLVAEKQYEEARGVLLRVLALSPEPGFERELAADKKLAKGLLEKIPNP